MKKGLIVVFGLMAVVLLSGCGNKNNQEEVVVHEVSLGDIYGKTSLTLEDLDAIESLLLPVSYSYETYELVNWSLSDSGEYVYSSGDKLLPIHESVASRELLDSSVEDGMIYTKVNLTLNDGKRVPMLYIND